ncbi:MAG: hypothetical protein ACO2OQ_00445 [Thermofilaceae archaeon]|jgi:hypothetical protein
MHQVVDAHVHPPLDAEEKGFSPRAVAERLLKWMDTNGVLKAVILPIAPYTSRARSSTLYPRGAPACAGSA